MIRRGPEIGVPSIALEIEGLVDRNLGGGSMVDALVVSASSFGHASPAFTPE
jgi:hypothetical protein